MAEEGVSLLRTSQQEARVHLLSSGKHQENLQILLPYPKEVEFFLAVVFLAELLGSAQCLTEFFTSSQVIHMPHQMDY